MNINEEKYIPNGVVEIIDAETGEKVYETHNMIVQSGRQLILGAIFNSAGTAFDTTKFKKFLEKQNADLTTPTMSYSDISSNLLNDSDIINPNIKTQATDQNIDNLTSLLESGKTIDLNKLYDKFDTNNLCMVMTFGVDFSSTSSQYSYITAVGLTYEQTLFSRANINPVYMRNGRKYVIRYTMYF